jgi:hypothetical protein
MNVGQASRLSSGERTECQRPCAYQTLKGLPHPERQARRLSCVDMQRAFGAAAHSAANRQEVLAHFCQGLASVA